MCSRYIISTTPEAIESKFGLSAQLITTCSNYNIAPGEYVPVIANDKPHEIQLLKFGLTPFWAKSEMNLFNARAEGDSNSEDNPTYRGAAGIIQKRAFRKPIRSQRCIVIASAFIEFPSNAGPSKPYLIYLRNFQNPFAMAGIWDSWLNPATGFAEKSFSIITTTANSLLRQIGSHRMPIILTDSEAKRWINSGTELLHITAMLKHYDSKLMNAYPVDPKIKNPLENDKQLIQPIGPRLLVEEKRIAFQIPRGSGYHQARRANQAADTTTMDERLELAKKKEDEIKKNEPTTHSQYVKYE
jgi:putative SOS response-associated peptidase YedK